jgi:hypothetical protein
MIFDQFKKLTVDRTVRATIGMSREKFDQLVSVFTQSERAIDEQRLANKDIRCLRKGGPPGNLDTPEKRLFFVLFYLKTYPTFDVLGFHFNLSAGHARDHITKAIKTLEHSLETLEVAPKREFNSAEDFKQCIEKYNKIIIDGMEVPCVRPTDKELQKARYSGKKNAIH